MSTDPLVGVAKAPLGLALEVSPRHQCSEMQRRWVGSNPHQRLFSLVVGCWLVVDCFSACDAEQQATEYAVNIEVDSRCFGDTYVCTHVVRLCTRGTGPLGAPRERASRRPRTGSRDHRPRPPQSPPPQKKNIHQVNFIYRDSPHGEVLEPQPPSPQKKYMLHTTAPWFRSVRAVLGGNPSLGFVGSHAQRGVLILRFSKDWWKVCPDGGVAAVTGDGGAGDLDGTGGGDQHAEASGW